MTILIDVGSKSVVEGQFTVAVGPSWITMLEHIDKLGGAPWMNRKYTPVKSNVANVDGS